MNKNEIKLFDAVKENDIKRIKKYIKKRNVDINAINMFGKPILFYAKNNLEISKMLINKGADVNKESPWLDNETSIFWSDVPELTELLIDKGVDVHKIADNGINSLFYKKNPETLKILLEHNVDPNHIDHANRVPLSLVKNVECAITLLNYGAKMQYQDGSLKGKDIYFELSNLIDENMKKKLIEYQYELEVNIFKKNLQNLKTIILDKEDMGAWHALVNNFYKDGLSNYVKDWIKKNNEFNIHNQEEIMIKAILKKNEVKKNEELNEHEEDVQER